MRWEKVPEGGGGGEKKKKKGAEDERLSLPLYLNETRAVLVTQVEFAGAKQSKVKAQQWVQRGVALVA